jgi:hypothetical protein
MKEYVDSGLLALLIGMVAWVIKLLGNHITHKLASIEKKLDGLPCTQPAHKRFDKIEKKLDDLSGVHCWGGERKCNG